MFIVFFYLKEVINMPKTKIESLFFTAITAFGMVYFMTVYNIVLSSGHFSNLTFLYAIKGMWTEYVLIFICAYFISSKLAQKCAFKIVEKGDRPIFIIVTIQIFTVLFQVAFASIIGLYKSYGFTTQFLPQYLTCYCKNFIMALPLQIFIVGPIARKIFRLLFIKRKEKTPQDKEMDDEIILDAAE